MTDTTIGTEQMVEGRTVRVADRPITFEQWLEICGPKDYSELIDGVLVEKPMVQWDHERLEIWLLRVLAGYVEEKDLGVVAGSRTATPINAFRGRLPDILFVRKDRLEIVQQKAVFGPPDLVIEIVSPSDRPMGLHALETDYRIIGVKEIWFLDQPRGRARILRQRDGEYEETEHTEGWLVSQAVEGFRVQVEWLFQEPRPSAHRTVTEMLKAE